MGGEAWKDEEVIQHGNVAGMHEERSARHGLPHRRRVLLQRLFAPVAKTQRRRELGGGRTHGRHSCSRRASKVGGSHRDEPRREATQAMDGELLAGPVAATGSYACPAIYPLDRCIRKELAIATYDSIRLYPRVYPTTLSFSFSRTVFCSQQLDGHRGRGRGRGQLVTERRPCSRQRVYPIHNATPLIPCHWAGKLEYEVPKQQRQYYRLLE